MLRNGFLNKGEGFFMRRRSSSRPQSRTTAWAFSSPRWWDWTGDRGTASQALSQFVVGTTATASQLEFIVQYLTENGVMDAARLYESPFTDISQQGPETLFLPGQVTEMIQVLNEIRKRAVA